jgi:hypothetical protein
MATAQESVLFPNSLHEAHQKATEKVKFKRDEVLNAKIILRAEELTSRYYFEQNGFVLRPAGSNAELFQEGKALQHCVGSYAQRYADGAIELFVIRRAEEPDKPFYTMEVQKDKVVQCRGLKNCAMTPEVKAFVEMFITKKLLTKKRTRIDVTNLNRQEVAI